MQSLELITESKIHLLLPGCDADSRLEASGLIDREGRFLVVFDNLSQVGNIEVTLSPGGSNEWLSQRDGATGFEDIAYEEVSRRYYLLIETVPVPGGAFQAEVIEYDEGFNQLVSHRLPFDFDRANKGFEGIACVRREGQEYLLALCEGNRCNGGSAGRKPGGGRIQVFRRTAQGWEHVDVLKVPPIAQFIDYASLDVRDSRVAVLSQASSQLWVGALQPDGWEFVDEGIVYRLPSDDEGETVYCYAEGVAWLDLDRVAVASDRKKKGDPKRGAANDESIHIFRIP
jgi:hypothetical protein